MAKKIFLSDIDLALNQLLKARLENLAVEPTAVLGRVYYDTSAINAPRYYNGTVWVTLIGSNHVSVTNAREPLPHEIASNEGLGDKHTIQGAAVGDVLRASAANAANFQKLSHDDLTAASRGVNSHDTIDQHLSNFEKHRLIDDNGTSNTVLFSAEKILSLIAAINSLIGSTLVFIGDYNASTNSPNLDNTPPAGIKKGHTYVVTVTGDFYDENVQPGDMLISKQDTPLAKAHWVLVNKNIPDILASTELIVGVIRISTETETTTGTNDLTAVSPLKLQQKLAGYTRRKTGLIPSLASFEVVHGLIGPVIVRVYRAKSPFDEVECEVIQTSDAITTFNFNVAPPADEYRYVIIG